MSSFNAVQDAPKTAIRKTWRQQKPRTKRLQNYFNQLLSQSHELETEFEKEKEEYAAEKESEIQLLKSENKNLSDQLATERCERDEVVKENNDMIRSYYRLADEKLKLQKKFDSIQAENSALRTEKDARLKQLSDYESELDDAWASMSYAYLRVKNVKGAASSLIYQDAHRKLNGSYKK
ncbi:uncharacterized protein N7477_008462 [Penicillium maclennaniae]|uniref:uncharacterized protein n=1 Tax=Penicillium maclennaniae TaxID=1343394 RepID=UPI00253FB8C2|nr:uncharacterized protein N7477_008462 [Penicillium maclennaniae]KAJ5666014.1 hypothetical protein N7477_008462 [Penicillium maclennaniae]